MPVTRVNIRGQALQSSLTRLVDTCYQTYLGRNHWLSKLQVSQWLSHIKEALSTAGLAAECIEREGTCVLVHGDEGANNTLLVTSLAQLILSPDCRTMVGFQDLIEREWLQIFSPDTSGLLTEREEREMYLSIQTFIERPSFLGMWNVLAP
ncbi:unnamed protein product [Ranitomeya imitator]|uniref:Myotubularin phosphatase domain-containing protein n=1 Tax=Ranitomeya imitator TaxID=111125 RepID=A0ABN9L1C5_9NEOB|nr:unnamed protein product [Ranitomeya imitator]